MNLIQVLNLTEAGEFMVFSRWQAPALPTVEQIKLIFQAEGLQPIQETCVARSKVGEHRHRFDEIRVVVSGQMTMNISGNQILLRAGDRVEIPSNTRHDMRVDTDEDCHCICATRTF